MLGLPATKRPASVSFALEHNAAVSQSPLSGTVQRVLRDGGRWRATLEWPPMIEDDAGIFAGWMDKAARGDRWLYLDNPANTIRGGLSVTNAVSDGYCESGTAAAWTAETDIALSVNARRLKVTNNSGSPAAAGGCYQTISLTASVPHVVVVDVDPGNTASATVQIRNATSFVVEASRRLDNAPGRISFVVTPSQASMQIRLVCNSDGHIYFRNITVTRCAQVSGASQTGNRLNVDGLPASQFALLKAGEMFCVKAGNAYELKRLTDDLDSDSSGAGTLVFEPALRSSPSDNEPCILWRPFGRFFVPAHASAVTSRPPGDRPIHGFMLDVVEDVTAVDSDGTYADETGEVIWEFDASTESLAPTEGVGTPSITRAGNTATRVTSAGLVEVVNANLARFDYDPVTLAIKGLLVEEARTNLLLRSAEFDNASWSKTDTTVTADSIASPDGGTNADLLTEGSAGTAVVQQTYTNTSNTTQVFSVFIKRGNHDWVAVQMRDNGAAGNNVVVWFNLATGSVGTAQNNGTATGAAGSIVSYGNGWYRCIISGAINNAATSVRGFTQSASADASGTRVANGTRYQWGAQAENNVAFATSYIPTTTASVTRAADVITLATASIPGFSASTLTMFSEWTLGPRSTTSTQTAMQIDDGTSNERFYIQRDSGSPVIYAGAVDGGVTVAANNLGDPGEGTTNKVASAVAANDSAASRNGAAVVTDATVTLPTAATFRVGSQPTGGYTNGHIRKLRLYNVRKSNAALQAMTQ